MKLDTNTTLLIIAAGLGYWYFSRAGNTFENPEKNVGVNQNLIIDPTTYNSEVQATFYKLSPAKALSSKRLGNQ